VLLSNKFQSWRVQNDFMYRFPLSSIDFTISTDILCVVKLSGETSSTVELHNWNSEIF
jgi:hypothetical protein